MLNDEINQNAIILYNYIKKLKHFIIVKEIDGNYRNIGATIIDAILQPGINYKNVVKPRVNKFLNDYSDKTTLKQFEDIISNMSIEQIINWKKGKKTEIILKLITLLREENVQTEEDFREWISKDVNIKKIKNISGIKCKTVDYIKILLGLNTNAIDRHLLEFIKLAGINIYSYHEAHEIISKTAELLNVNEAYFDHSIWKYMSEKKYTEEI